MTLNFYQVDRIFKNKNRFGNTSKKYWLTLHYKYNVHLDVWPFLLIISVKNCPLDLAASRTFKFESEETSTFGVNSGEVDPGGFISVTASSSFSIFITKQVSASEAFCSGNLAVELDAPATVVTGFEVWWICEEVVVKLKVFDGERFIFFASYSLLIIRSSFFRFTGGSAITVFEGVCPLSNISAFTGFFTKIDEIFRKRGRSKKYRKQPPWPCRRNYSVLGPVCQRSEPDASTRSLSNPWHLNIYHFSMCLLGWQNSSNFL